MIVPVISDRFTKEISQHLVLNYVAIAEHPLILGIFGSPGEGKTFQLRTLLNRLGVEVFSINAADMESDRAGVPGKLVVEQYVAAAHRAANGSPGALVVDDVDTTLGEWEGNTGTVNHQQVLAQLMHLADEPEAIERIGSVRRIPIFVTGNDPSKVYSPLRRPGRMAILYWRPSAQERFESVTAIFSETLPVRKVKELIDRYPHHPIAFFSQLDGEIRRQAAATVIAKSATDLAAVVQAPEKYALYIRAAIAASPENLTPIVDELARELDAAFRAADASYLGHPSD
jgi:SpoVK/Ycf46/Vps4 family AAA+-type ATPase